MSKYSGHDFDAGHLNYRLFGKILIISVVVNIWIQDTRYPDWSECWTFRYPVFWHFSSVLVMQLISPSKFWSIIQIPFEFQTCNSHDFEWPLIYLFIYFVREKQIDVQMFWKNAVRILNVWKRAYVLHNKCEFVTGKKVIFFI